MHTSHSSRPTALITGASRGIGLAAAGALAEKGYDLILTCSRTFDDLLSASAGLEETCQVSVRSLLCDVGDPDAVEALFQEIGRLDLLVNNAGIACSCLAQDMDPGTWNRILSVNLSGCFYTSRLAIPLFLKQGSGRIINVSSVWGTVGASMETAYSASKGGVNAFTRALAKELAPSHIPVNALACGCIDTSMNDVYSEEEKRALASEIPADRFGTPEEAAAVICQLAEAPLYLTGQIITLDGGWI